MRSSKEKRISKSSLILLVYLSIILATSLNPPELFPKETAEKKSAPSRETGKSIEHEKNGLKHKRFQIELYGGFSTLNLSDYNLLADYDFQIQNFFYDVYYDYLRDNGQISSWSKEQDGKYKKIKNVIPFGFRLKIYLNNSIAFSAGFKYLSRNHSNDLDYQYVITENNGSQYIDNKKFSPYSLSVRGHAEMAGIHFEKKIMDSIGIEAYFMGGPLFVECVYMADWLYELWYRDDVYTLLMYDNDSMLEESGTGTGFVLDFGGRINIALKHNLGLFFEGGYAYQVAKKISGSGRETRDNSTTSWQGEWGIIEENIQTPWGNLELQLPTNYWKGWSKDLKIRDFKLDLSGFQMRIGVSYKF